MICGKFLVEAMSHDMMMILNFRISDDKYAAQHLI